MNQVQVIEFSEPNYQMIKQRLQEENLELNQVLDRIVGLKRSFDSNQLGKDISVLKEATRIQNMNTDMKSLMLIELERRKLIKQVIDGERN
jgi:hypothetical protein